MLLESNINARVPIAPHLAQCFQLLQPQKGRMFTVGACSFFPLPQGSHFRFRFHPVDFCF